MSLGWHFIQNDNILDSTFLPLLWLCCTKFDDYLSFVYLIIISVKYLVIKRIKLNLFRNWKWWGNGKLYINFKEQGKAIKKTTLLFGIKYYYNI